ncbi:MAG: response regulator transcription factor [Sandaracinaceae bacterium]|nr:response regulator transcription factor [Sandaracinaceae bacterium]
MMRQQAQDKSFGKLRAIVVDDEPLARDELQFLLEECGVEVLGEAKNAKEALRLFDEVSPNIAFVDLKMPGPDGITLAETLRSRKPNVHVVIVSAHDDGAIRGFEAGVTDYLLKPVRLSRLRKTLDRLIEIEDGQETNEEPLERLAIKRRGAFIVVELHSVVYFEVRDELVWAVTSDDRYALDLTLANIEKRLDPQAFFRTHRGAIVRLERIRAIEPTGSGTYEVLLDHPDKPRVPLARERARQLREKIPVAG